MSEESNRTQRVRSWCLFPDPANVLKDPRSDKHVRVGSTIQLITKLFEKEEGEEKRESNITQSIDHLNVKLLQVLVSI